MSFQTGTVWTFRAGRYRVALHTQLEDGFIYDGEDATGEIQSKIDDGEYVAFWSMVTVELDGALIGSDSLYGSVYAWDEMSDFWTAHRDSNPMNRNCSVMRAARGGNASIVHYFPGMVREAIKQARDWHNRNCRRAA